MSEIIHRIESVEQVPAGSITIENLLPKGTAASTKNSAPAGEGEGGVSHCVEVVTALGHIVLPVWFDLADVVLIKKYGSKDAITGAVSLAAKTRDYADNPAYIARKLMLEGRMDVLADAELAEPIEGLCCDCVCDGPCCDFSENKTCPCWKEDGSCWHSKLDVC